MYPILGKFSFFKVYNGCKHTNMFVRLVMLVFSKTMN
mgnify:CR=1 FL=1